MKRWLSLALALLLFLSATAAAAFAEDWEKRDTELDVLGDKRIGIATGSIYGPMVEERFPGAKLSYYNSYTDLAAALSGNKIDAFPVSSDTLKLMMRENSHLSSLPGYLLSFDCGFVFAKTAKGRKLCAEFDEFMRELKVDGSYQELEERWFSLEASADMVPDYAAFPAAKGTLTMATTSGFPPFEYVENGRLAGIDIDHAARFCQSRGYGLKIIDMSFDGVLASVESGKCDFAAAGIAITPERQESLLFSEPNYSGGVVFAVLDSFLRDVESEGAEDASFRDGVRASFEKTFLREERWRLFLGGVGTTLAITLLSILFGTLLGFGVYLLCRTGNRAANAVTGFCTWLVQGMPMVVLLMILYYIVFGRVAVSGTVVAVIGFSLTFGAGVYAMLRMAVGTVERGQYEAAVALGFSGRRAFYRVVLPQALPHVMPAYRGEIVGLIKATAVVGYIAVQDLTKVGDIVRSRTYEAFFPLIAITVIYFALEGLVVSAVKRLQIRLDPKRRKPEQILKGVRADDTD